MARRWDFEKNKRQFDKLKRKLPGLLGKNTVNFFKTNFVKQGFVDRSLSKWKPRDPDNDPGRGILIQTGALKRSIRLVQSNFRKIVIATNDKKAKFHNKGTDRMPKRQFMGNSVTLRKQNSKIIKRELKKVFA